MDRYLFLGPMGNKDIIVGNYTCNGMTFKVIDILGYCFYDLENKCKVAFSYNELVGMYDSLSEGYLKRVIRFLVKHNVLYQFRFVSEAILFEIDGNGNMLLYGESISDTTFLLFDENCEPSGDFRNIISIEIDRNLCFNYDVDYDILRESLCDSNCIPIGSSCFSVVSYKNIFNASISDFRKYCKANVFNDNLLGYNRVSLGNSAVYSGDYGGLVYISGNEKDVYLGRIMCNGLIFAPNIKSVSILNYKHITEFDDTLTIYFHIDTDRKCIADFIARHLQCRDVRYGEAVKKYYLTDDSNLFLKELESLFGSVGFNVNENTILSNGKYSISYYK